MIILSGQLEIGFSDGTTKVFGPGDARLVEDTMGKGHTTAFFGNEPVLLHRLTTLLEWSTFASSREGIRANCIAPGPIHASFTTDLSAKTRELRSRSVPLGSEGTAWDIAMGRGVSRER